MSAATPTQYILFIGVLGGLVQGFVPYCGMLLLRGGVSDGVGGWVSRGSPPVGELPVVARCRSRGFA